MAALRNPTQNQNAAQDIRYKNVLLARGELLTFLQNHLHVLCDHHRTDKSQVQADVDKIFFSLKSKAVMM